MKRVSVFLLSMVSLAFFSCQKELSSTDVIPPPADTTVSPPMSFYKIKTYTEDVTIAGVNTVGTFNLAYDANNRIVNLISATSPGDKFIYQYNANTSLTMDLYNANVLSIHEVLFLNSFLLPDSTFQYNDTKDSSTEKYFYNTAKQLVQLNEYDYSIATGALLYNTTHYTYDSSGNVVSYTDNFSATTVDYFDIANNIVAFPYVNLKPAKLIKTITITSGGVTYIIHHTYTFDNISRVISDKKEIDGSSDVGITSYTYY